MKVAIKRELPSENITNPLSPLNSSKADLECARAKSTPKMGNQITTALRISKIIDAALCARNALYSSEKGRTCCNLRANANRSDFLYLVIC